MEKSEVTGFRRLLSAHFLSFRNSFAQMLPVRNVYTTINASVSIFQTILQQNQMFLAQYNLLG